MTIIHVHQTLHFVCTCMYSNKTKAIHWISASTHYTRYSVQYNLCAWHVYMLPYMGLACSIACGNLVIPPGPASSGGNYQIFIRQIKDMFHSSLCTGAFQWITWQPLHTWYHWEIIWEGTKVTGHSHISRSPNARGVDPRVTRHMCQLSTTSELLYMYSICVTFQVNYNALHTCTCTLFVIN